MYIRTNAFRDSPCSPMRYQGLDILCMPSADVSFMVDAPLDQITYRCWNYDPVVQSKRTGVESPD